MRMSKPGRMAFTLTVGAYFSAKDSTMFCSADLVAAYPIWLLLPRDEVSSQIWIMSDLSSRCRCAPNSRFK
ncbi:hypothetical protein D3C72_2122160 [compost metagenome]